VGGMGVSWRVIVGRAGLPPGTRRGPTGTSKRKENPAQLPSPSPPPPPPARFSGVTQIAPCDIIHRPRPHPEFPFCCGGQSAGGSTEETPLTRQRLLSRAFRLKTRRTIITREAQSKNEKGVRTSGVVAGGSSNLKYNYAFVHRWFTRWFTRWNEVTPLFRQPHKIKFL
jgi:hypothetical protein